MRVFDNQRLKDFQNCNRYAYYRHERHLVPAGVSTALAFGASIHAGLETHYRGGDVKSTCKAFADMWVNEYGNPDGDDKRNLNNGIFILEAYTREHSLDREPFTVLAVEEQIPIQLTEDIYYAGKMDVVAKGKPGSGIEGVFVIDHKTTSMWSNIVLESVNPNRQFTGYILLLTSMYDNVYGAMLNSIFVHASKRQVRRVPTTRSDVQLAQFTMDTLEIIRQWDHCRETSTWPQSTEYCIKWNRHCEYAKLCQQNIHPEKVLIHPGDFEESPWRPFEVEELGL